MLTDQVALVFLENQTSDPEVSRSSYWERECETFSVDAGGRFTGHTVLGTSAPGDAGVHKAVHWMLQAPFRWMGRRFPAHPECQRLGRLVAAGQGRLYWLDTIRQVLSLALILEHVPLMEPRNLSLVIGDGFGVMTSLLLLARPQRRVAMVNLTKPLLLDLVYARMVVPGLRVALPRDCSEMEEALADAGVRIIAVLADDAPLLAGRPVDLAVNIASMQEMDPPMTAGYFDLMRKSTSDVVHFYCCNRLEKTLPDGTVSRFHDYPWRAGDIVVIEGVSPWHQIRYSPRPPFWHWNRNERLAVWHRLARLQKDPG